MTPDDDRYREPAYQCALHGYQADDYPCPCTQRYVAVHRNGRSDWQHREIAEKALGKPLPEGAEVHHIDGTKRNNANRNLVICQDRAYHALLHVRARVVRAGGDPNTQRLCGRCKQLKPLSEFYVRRRGPRAGNPISQCIGCVSMLNKRFSKGLWVPRHDLTQSEKDTIRCRVLEGHKHKDIARDLGVDKSTVSKALRRENARLLEDIRRATTAVITADDEPRQIAEALAQELAPAAATNAVLEAMQRALTRVQAREDETKGAYLAQRFGGR
jgi:DNA-binding MarR family transcriptional regulator